MTLAQIKASLEQSLSDKQLVLSPTMLNGLPLGSLLNLLETDQFVVKDVELAVSTENVVITGTSSVLGSADIGTGLTFTETDGDVACALNVTLPSWQIPELQWLVMHNVQLNLSIAESAGDVSGSVSGDSTIGGVPAVIAAEIGDTLILTAAVPTLNLSDISEQILGGQITLPNEVPDFELSSVEIAVTPKTGEFSFSGQSFTTPWEIPIGIDGLNIEGIQLSVNRALSDDGTKAVTGTIAGTLNIGTASFSVEYNFPGEFILMGQIPSFKLSPLVQDLCGPETIRNLPVPASLLAIELTDMALTIAPQAKSCSLSGGSDFGQAEVIIQPVDGGGWGFGAGFVPPAAWKFSAIAQELSVLDGLDFSGTALIVSSAADKAFELATIEIPRDDVKVEQGLNFFASLNMSGLGVDELTGIRSLDVYAAIGGNPANLVLEAAIDGEFQLGDGVAFGDITFRLRPSPANFSITLLGALTAVLDDSALRFVGGLQVQPRSALMQATMEGVWNEPFDTRGVAIANLALELGLSFPPVLPSIGIAGTLQIGAFMGAAAVKFDSAFPGRSMVAIGFNRLYLMDVLSAFCGPTVTAAIPQSLKNTLLNIGYEDVNIYIVPQATTIGELTFEQGFTLQGTMLFWGLRAYAYMNMDYVEGIVIRGAVDPIEVGNGIFTLRGVGGNPKPSLYLELAPGKVPSLDISGSVSLLGLYSETQIRLSDSGFYFKTSGKIYSLFECTIEAQGGNFSAGDDFFVKVYLRNDLFVYLRDEASKAIKAAADSATREIEKAQRDVRKAQSEVDKINNDIAAMRQTIQKERERDTRNLQNAQAEVTKAQNEVNRLNTEIDQMRRVIRGERERDTKNLRSAQAAVTKAQNDVNSIQSEINSTKRRIDQLKDDIKNKERWYKKLPWYKKSWGWAELGAYSAAKGSEITANYTKLGGLEAAKHTAIGVLEVAKQTLRGIEEAAKTFPIDADPRIVGLFTARETATAALAAAKLSLKGFEEAAKTFPIDADPRIIGLFAARETATAGVQAAYYTLEGVKVSVGGLAEVSDFIARVGLGGLIDIRSAYFEAYLNTAQGGNVMLDLTLTFMDQPQRLTFGFNFNDPLSSARQLGQKLLPA